MLVKHFHLSESSANQRIKALELMMAVPQVEGLFQSGEVNLTTLAMAQREIRREEKATGDSMTPQKKAEIVEIISGKTQIQAEKELMRALPNAAADLGRAVSERRVSENAVRLNLTLPDRVRDKLMRLKDRWAHVDATLDYVTLIERCADLALEKTDKIGKAPRTAEADAEKNFDADKKAVTDKKTSPNMKAQCATESVAQLGNPIGNRPSYYPRGTDRILWSRAGSQCEYVDELTGRRCVSHFKLQRDHIIPLAKGGSNEIKNLRLLCQTHNLQMAKRHFGERKPR
jgi:hypothetical protein